MKTRKRQERNCAVHSLSSGKFLQESINIFGTLLTPPTRLLLDTYKRKKKEKDVRDLFEDQAQQQ
jgi:hypothetical protein